MCVYVCVCVCVCVHMCVYVCMYVCMYVCVYVHMYMLCTFVHVFIYMCCFSLVFLVQLSEKRHMQLSGNYIVCITVGEMKWAHLIELVEKATSNAGLYIGNKLTVSLTECPSSCSSIQSNY